MEEKNTQLIIPKQKKIKWSIIISAIAIFSVGFLGGHLLADDSTIIEKNSQDTANIVRVSTSSNEGELSIVDIAELTANSVVQIETESVTRGYGIGQFISSGAGSGVVVTSDGYILTNNHVIDDASKITVTLADGTEYKANLKGKDTETDIALIKIDADNLQPVILGDSSGLRVGELAVAVGNPLGELGGTVTDGIISALDREIDFDGITMNLLQTNAAINPGNSGGGLFNSRGELIGIIVAKSAGSDIEGIGFAIPINDVKEVIDDIRDYGYVKGRPELGVVLIDVNSINMARLYGLSHTGIYIQEVNEGSSAENAGLKVGDRIVSFGGNEVTSAEGLKSMINKCKVGEKVEIGISRDGRMRNVEVIMMEAKR